MVSGGLSCRTVVCCTMSPRPPIFAVPRQPVYTLVYSKSFICLPSSYLTSRRHTKQTALFIYSLSLQQEIIQICLAYNFPEYFIALKRQDFYLLPIFLLLLPYEIPNFSNHFRQKKVMIDDWVRACCIVECLAGKTLDVAFFLDEITLVQRCYIRKSDFSREQRYLCDLDESVRTKTDGNRCLKTQTTLLHREKVS